MGVDYRLLQHTEGEPERERGRSEEGVQEAGNEVGIWTRTRRARGRRRPRLSRSPRPTTCSASSDPQKRQIYDVYGEKGPSLTED